MPNESLSSELSIEVVLRLLGEYTGKVRDDLDRRRRSVATVGLGLVAMVGFGLFTQQWEHRFTWLSIGIALAVAAATALWVDRMRVDLAVHQLRRIYELASRLEDLGRQADLALQLELELRLSEARFLLNRVPRAGLRENSLALRSSATERVRPEVKLGSSLAQQPEQTPRVPART